MGLGKGLGKGKGEARGEGKGSFIFSLYRDLLEMGRHILGCACCCLCIGPILLLVAVIFLAAAAANSRADQVKKYNAAVDTWNTGVRTSFEQATFVNLDPPSGVSGTFSADTSADPIRDSDTKGLHTYTALKYTTTGLDAPVPSDSSGTYSWSVQATQQGSPSKTLNTVITTKQSTTKSPSQLSQTCSTTSTSGSSTRSSSSSSNNNSPSCSQVCQDDGGSWTGSECRFVAYMSQVCLKVTLDSSSQYAVSGEFGGNGCFPCLAYTRQQRAICTDYEVSVLSTGSASFSSVPVVIRNKDDPYIALGHITDGTFNFGLSRAALLLLAIVFFAIGGFFCCGVYGSLWFVANWLRTRNGGKSYQAVGNRGGAAPYAQAQPAPYGQQPYAQPQPQYGSQPQPYGQPQGAPPPPGFYQAPAPSY
ncbi:uncharacterized protein AMSG_03473 [Thecamonas trahens ATCC 50062]|uniref:Uncharacterized protein n=1 Tax=Thecamonas trahens ATCC 50062 TaxID=461836 RepID=A0A0L0D6W1_THETB|nr:hypothetical protein AMSG_03473 [Thecamonas trahens ATCC 50062]KNC47048.1 hypothetical protein AMSG_03473 [Thecamonas trahens ATCC 50062]|eukprot:XP_013759828.1 hypothetical protein AMSG_03473 [Thecamonas trahens ATCC 50062]